MAGGVHNWSEFTVDEANGIAFINFGSPRFDFYGGDRKGDNLFGNSLVAIDARTGKRIWHFTARPSRSVGLRPAAGAEAADDPPERHATSTSWRRRRSRVPVRVRAQDRPPIWPIEERKVPQSDVPGEWTSPTQPFPTKPAPFARQSFTEKDINPYLPKAEQDALRERMQDAAQRRAVHAPELRGIDSDAGPQRRRELRQRRPSIRLRGEFYVVHKALPTVIRIALPGAEAPDGGGGGGGGGGRGGGPIVTPEQKAELMAKAKELVEPRARGCEFASPYEFMNIDSRSMAAIGPPWSEMVEYDLNTGDIKWRISAGQRGRAARSSNIPANTGSQFPRNAPLVTAGGLIFVATGPERKVRAYDRDNGKELWVRDLPNGVGRHAGDL